MEMLFGEQYKYDEKASVSIIENLLDSEEFITVPGKNIALEITL